MMRQRGEVARRTAERRERENSAPRLLEKVPELESLVLELVTRRGDMVMGEYSYTRRVVVESAPALFEVACPDRSCEGGGCDITWNVLSALGRKETAFSGEESCTGSVGTATCSCILRFKATATYRAASA